jgi:hypothetical protein
MDSPAPGPEFFFPWLQGHPCSGIQSIESGVAISLFRGQGVGIEVFVLDIIFIVATIVLLGIAVLYVRACERLH